MKSILKIIVITVAVAGLLWVVGYSLLIYNMGHHFVHGESASQEYYDHIRNRITFSAPYRGDTLDSLLNIFMLHEPGYRIPDSIPQSDLNGSGSCDCNCYPFKKQLYFSKHPREIFEITFDTDGSLQHSYGAVDIVYSYRHNQWVCTKSSQIDSAEKIRIEGRFKTEVLNRLVER